MQELQLSPSDPEISPIRLAAGSIAIGRHPDNDIPLVEDKVASRFHCVIELDQNGQFILKDLGARNGTRLNGETVSASPIGPGDVITVGQHSFTVEVASAPTGPNGHQSAVSSVEEISRVDAKAPWAQRLKAMADAVAPRDEPLPPVTLIDARGVKSHAFEGAGEGSVATRQLIQLASKSRATDIHLEPKPDRVTIRMRIDGQMLALLDLPSKVGDLIHGLIRAACHMKQASRMEILEGHLAVQFPDRRVDYRISITPTMHGPKMVVRVLDQVIAPQSLGRMNLPVYMYDRLRSACRETSGMILAAGPTGSGKTTTLYNALREINRNERNVVTIEDPVEYSIDGVTQIPLGGGSTFADLLKSILRQDPDVILVGEIRDEETGRTTMQAAMTGHLVFSTIHAKDSIGSVFRLLDLGTEPYLVANSMDLVIAQRLVRILCQFCKRPVRVTPSQATRLGRFLGTKDELFAATGCPRCLRTGFHGRRAVFELLDFNDHLRDCVLSVPTIGKMRQIIEQGVFTSLTQSGWLLASNGQTSLDEAERVTGG